MLVRTLRPHFNGYGQAYAKAVGDEYDHPSPNGMIAQGLVELADGASVPAGRRKGTGSSARGTAIKGNRSKRSKKRAD